MSRAIWRHCCVERRYASNRTGEELSIRYMDSDDDFELVARDLADAFWLLQRNGWQLVAVTGKRLVGGRPGPRLRASVESYYFKRAEEQAT
jgi:hypothetical protein